MLTWFGSMESFVAGHQGLTALTGLLPREDDVPYTVDLNTADLSWHRSTGPAGKCWTMIVHRHGHRSARPQRIDRAD
jgi:hypothetical protein